MVTAWAHQRCLERIDALGRSSADLIEMRLGALEELRRVVGFDRWCAMLTDPASLVPWRALSAVDWWRDTPLLNRISTAGDPQSVASLARSRRVADTLARTTAGDKNRSPAYREVLGGYGCGDEIRAAVMDRTGTWGALHLFRSSDDRDFSEHELALVRDVAGVLAGGLRRAVTVRHPASTPDETGVLVVDDSLTVHSRTASAAAWLERLNPERIAFPDDVPGVVWAVVGTLQGAEAGAESGPARVRVQTADGAWGVIEAARLSPSSIAVTLRSARPAELVDLLVRAHGLTPREAEIASLVVAGVGTAAIAERLVISRHTVEDHVKSAMAKAGARTRRALAEAFGAAG